MSEPKLLTIPTFTDRRGSLSVLAWKGDLPFHIERCYYLYRIPAGEIRAGHAHWVETEMMVAVHGSFTVRTDDGASRREFRLEDPGKGLLVPPGVWHELCDFRDEAVCMVFASNHYDVDDYCRDYDEFLRLRRSR